MRISALLALPLLLGCTHALGDAAIANGGMSGTPVDHSGGKGLLVTPPGWTPVNINVGRGDRLSVEASGRPGGGQCLHVKTFGSDAGVYQTVHPLTKGRSYILTAWMKRLSGAAVVEAYSYGWGPAIVRLVDATGSGWTHVAAAFSTIDDGAHVYLVASPKADFLIDDVELRPAAVQVTSPERRPYDLGKYVRFRVEMTGPPNAGKPIKIKVQAVGEKPGQTFSTPVVCTLRPRGTAVADLALPVDQEGVFWVRVTNAATGQLLGGSQAVTLSGSPWDVRYPYKNSLFHSLGYKWPVSINLIGAPSDALDGTSASATIYDAAGKVVRRVSARTTQTGLVADLDGSRLSPGDYRLALLVRAASGRTVFAGRRPLRVLPPAANEVVISPSGDTLVNGHRFFPIGLYWVLANPAGWKPGPARKTADLLDLRHAGINTLHSYAFEHNNAADTDDNALAYLDMAQELGFKVMMGLRRDWYQGAKLNAAAIERRVERLKNHPALLCWTLWDEPNFAAGAEPKVQAVYDIVNRVDPYHPAMPVFGGTSGRPFRNAADIDLFDCYPGAGNAGVLPSVFDRARASMPDKPIWFVAQAHELGGKIPSEEDMRLFYQDALAGGAKGIFWYSYGGDGKAWDSIRLTPEHFAAAKRIFRELANKVGEK